MNDMRSRLFALAAAMTTGLAFSANAQEQAPSYASFVEPTLKAGFRFTSPPALPTTSLGLMAPEEEPGERLCGIEYAAAAMPIGDREQYAKLAGAAKGVGIGLLSRALSSASDGAIDSGGGGRRERDANEPELYEDPIDKKETTKVKDRVSKVELRLGGEVAADGILLSTRLEDVKDKGTVHEIYLERDDCRRIYPFVDYTYELWGEWNLSVSWSTSSRTYQDGQLVDEQTSSGGFMRSGEGFLDAESSARAFSDALEDVPAELRGPLTRYHAQIQDELGAPMWQRLGFAAPTSGARHVGNMFRMAPSDLQALRDGRYRLIVQVTGEERRFYKTLGVPVAIGLEGDELTFAEIERD
jgi:hypothetical protein